jgi:regulatory protein spx
LTGPFSFEENTRKKEGETMIQMYITSSCSSCRKAKKWFEKYHIDFKEKNIFAMRLTREEIFEILRHTENGFEDIISDRSKIVKESNVDFDAMSINELADYIIDHPTMLRRPIIIEDDKLLVGYNEDEIRMFFPKELRKMIMENNVDQAEEVRFVYALNQYLDKNKKTKSLQMQGN